MLESLRGGLRLHLELGDAPVDHFQNLELEVVPIDALSRLREHTGLGEDEAADRLVRNLAEFHLEQLFENFYVAGTGEQPDVVAETDAIEAEHLVLVDDLTDDLLQQILDGDEPRGAAELVDDHGQLLVLGLELAQ